MIEKTVLLACSPDRAFVLLTQDAGQWWPGNRRHTADVNSVIRIEAEGRFYERASDGHEVELGVVRVFEPPHRLVLDWYPGTGPSEPTHVVITLEAQGPQTLVRLRHQAGPASIESYAKRALAFAANWDLVFDAWETAAAAPKTR